MTTEENKAIVRRHLIDVLEQGHVELIPDYYAPDGSVSGMDTPEQWKTRVLDHHRIAPGYKITILDMVAEGEKVAVLWQADLTYTVMSEPPPEKPPYPFGKAVTWKIMNLARIVDGKLVSWTGANDYGWMLIEAGLYVLAKPEPATS